MSLLIAVKSCHKHRLQGYNEAIRSTWGGDVKEPNWIRYFHGVYDLPISEHRWEEQDEIALPVLDNYDSLPHKTRAILNSFLMGMHSHIFLCDTDTFVVPEKLLKCDYENYDIAGRYGNVWPIGTTKTITDDRFNRHINAHPWPSGGVGYFLSRKAAEFVSRTPFEHWAEDFMVGQITGPAIQRGELRAADLPNFECVASWHFQRRQYDNQVYDLKFKWMERMYSIQEL